MASYRTRLFVVTAATLLVIATTFSLGLWQLRRAAQKVALQAEIQGRSSLLALDDHALVATKNIAIHRRARLQGHWQDQHTVYLDNRPMNGKTGFWVITPLQLRGSEQSILVQRGWVPRDFVQRTNVPSIQTPSGLITVSGRIAPPPSKLYEFKGADEGRIRQNLDLAAFRAQTGLQLLEVALVQTDPASEGLQRDWATPDAGLAKHYGYAFQWFSLSALAAILYFWFQIFLPYRAKKLRAKHRDPRPF